MCERGLRAIAEQPVVVGGHERHQVGHRQAASVRDGGGRERDEGRLVPLAAVRHGRQVGGVGFNQQSVEWHHAHGLPQFDGPGEREDPGQREIEARRHRAFGHPRVAREAVEHARERAAGLGLGDQLQRVGLGLAGVDGHRQPTRLRQRQLRAEHGLLHVLRRKIVVVVEADLANGPHEQRLGEAGGHGVGRGRRVGREDVGLVRMNPDSEPHRRPQRRQSLRACPFRVILRRQNHQRTGDPRRAAARNHGIEIGDEFLAGKMAVTIDHGRGSGPGPRRAVQARTVT